MMCASLLACCSFVLIGVIWMDVAHGSGRRLGEEQPADISRKTWAIAIHGGAGSDPVPWDERKIEARKQGLARALATGRDMLAEGRSALDTVESVIRVLEDDAAFNAGRGAVLTEEGRAELDASIMDGETLSLRCGCRCDPCQEPDHLGPSSDDGNQTCAVGRSRGRSSLPRSSKCSSSIPTIFLAD